MLFFLEDLLFSVDVFMQNMNTLTCITPFRSVNIKCQNCCMHQVSRTTACTIVRTKKQAVTHLIYLAGLNPGFLYK